MSNVAESTQTEAVGETAIPLVAAFEEFLVSAHRLQTALGESKAFALNRIGVGELAVLNILGNGPQLQQQVLRKSGVSRQRIRKLLIELEAKGLVTVVRSSSDDKRRRIIRATSLGLQTKLATLATLAEAASQLDAMPRDPAKLIKRLGAFSKFSERLANSIRRDARLPNDAKPGSNK